ncbi:MAG: phosphoribosylformylglycinamidine synthase [Pseudomonadota bacterium]
MIMPLFGSVAASEFRTQQLNETLGPALGANGRVTTRYVYLIDAERDLTRSESEKLKQLLGAVPTKAVPTEKPTFVVCPRVGTISPWSSKATEILRICGLQAVARVERGVAWYITAAALPLASDLNRLADIYDPLLETVFETLEGAGALFQQASPRALVSLPAGDELAAAMAAANAELGLGLEDSELAYLGAAYRDRTRGPTDVELMMFAQVNSEHCRHKIFNAAWTIDGQRRNQSLFDMIRNTYQCNPGRVLSAYSDNCAVTTGWPAESMTPHGPDNAYRNRSVEHHILMKVETHNHPTAISPFPGAATGSGGEIRDEGATGRGARGKAGLTGFSVSNLRVPAHPRAWEQHHGTPQRIATALQIMLEAPIGAAAFNNEFGRPALAGYFRTFEREVDGVRYGYHKPIMLAGGLGNVTPPNVLKVPVRAGDRVVVLGGPAMLIGLGGGAASSKTSGSGDAGLDFASVQRGNAEMQRRAQQVIDWCAARGADNPIRALHDVGAGGLSNAIPELVHGGGNGARLNLRLIPSADPGMSPLEIWCNEAQERYVLAIAPEHLGELARACTRERCPFADLGAVTDDGRLLIEDPLLGRPAVDIPMDVLLGKLPRMQRSATSEVRPAAEPGATTGDLANAWMQILDTPTVGDKGFLITIGDRTVGGLSHRDQMVGPWQVPVADCAVTLTDHTHSTGEALAMGERTPLAVINAAAAARMAVAEAITNIASAPVGPLSNVVLSANWMAACGHAGQDAALFAAVQAVGLELCPALGINIPVGKDSLSMKTVWEHRDVTREVIAPVSLVVSAFAPVTEVSLSLTPELQRPFESSSLVLVDLGCGQHRLGGSVYADQHGGFTAHTPDLDDPALLSCLFEDVQKLLSRHLLLAYHDRSDGGLAATLAEMAFAGAAGLDIDLSALEGDGAALLFSEEPGVVLQVADGALDSVLAELRGTDRPYAQHVHVIGRPTTGPDLVVRLNSGAEMKVTRSTAREHWSAHSHQLARLRDHPDAADAEHRTRQDERRVVGAHVPPEVLPATAIKTGRLRAAILREQGVNGHNEMAAAFLAAGFVPVDVHMHDILSGAVDLSGFQALAACGGFSYGDVLGAGGGWAGSVRCNDRARDAFQKFFEDPQTLTLGVCNGCQMLAQLADLIPGTEHWPTFERNASQQFEGRLATVEILAGPSIWLQRLAGACLPVPVAHGEGRAHWRDPLVAASAQASVRFVSGEFDVDPPYPLNPNGSRDGATGFSSRDGRVTIMMPHPERAVRAHQLSWKPARWSGYSPWLHLFTSAHAALDD